MAGKRRRYLAGFRWTLRKVEEERKDVEEEFPEEEGNDAKEEEEEALEQLPTPTPAPTLLAPLLPPPETRSDPDSH